VCGLILDVDGTLLDSNDAHARAYVDALARSGVKVPFDRLRSLIGMGGEKLLAKVGVDAKSHVGKEVTRAKKEIFAELLPDLRPTPGARDLLAHAKKCGLVRVVATSAGADELHDLLRRARVDDLIESQSTSSDAAASKPDPDIVEAAAARAALPRGELVMLGDTPYDIEAAGRAGVASIAVRCGGWGDRDLAGAAEIYDDPADLLVSYARSILARL
jgi:HAD superfamily hydrolase (TIGR01509 family)